MNKSVNDVALKMKNHFGSDSEKIQHFVRVYTIAKSIGELEKLPEITQEYLELAALMHEIEGEDKVQTAKEILISCDVDDDTALRVCHIIENLHCYDRITGLDHQILIEADMIVTFKESGTKTEEIIRIANERFITNYGKAFLKKAFNI